MGEMSLPAPATAAPSITARLPLYLYGRRATRVQRDGPALLVRRATLSDARYPLARLSRIISRQSVEWSASALSACMEARIPIVFLDGRHQPVGYLFPPIHAPSRLDAVLKEFLDFPDWPDRYADWLRAERMRILRDWRARRNGEGRPVNETQYRELVQCHVYQSDPAPPESAGAWIHAGALTAWALRCLQDAGLAPTYWGHDGEPLHLASDLARLLDLALTLELHGLGESVHGGEDALLRVLHAFGQHIREQCLRILGRLHRNIRERLELWR